MKEEKKVNHAVFGEMIYKRAWEKVESLEFWGETYDLKIKAAAYSKQEITEEQGTAYSNFKENLKIITDKSLESLKNYLIEEEKVDFITEIKPRTLLIKQNGDLGLLLDCPWDDHGLVVVISKAYTVGVQDIFL